MSETVYIGLGSNLATPITQITEARLAISKLPGVIKELNFSSLYRSPPMGPQDQPDYVNAVLAVNTHLSVFVLLAHLQRIELNQGRLRKQQRWGARTLDLDILLYGQQQINAPDLTVPHYGITERAFVLYPLYEIAPDLKIPNKGLISDLLKKCPLDGLVKIP